MASPYYSDDLVTLYHADCRESLAWLDADVLVCDPPYGINYQQGGPRSNADGVRSVTPTARVVGDADTSTRDAVLGLWGTLRPALVFGSWKVARPQNVRQRLVWFKRNTNPGLGTGTPWSPADEEIYVLADGWIGPRELNVLVTDEARASAGGLAALTGHPTPKPVGLMEQLIAHCPPGLIADPFAGSGATLLAARGRGRCAVGVEIDEAFHCPTCSAGPGEPCRGSAYHKKRPQPRRSPMPIETRQKGPYRPAHNTHHPRSVSRHGEPNDRPWHGNYRQSYAPSRSGPRLRRARRLRHPQ